jgi:flagellar motor switch protein FliN/FliY
MIEPTKTPDPAPYVKVLEETRRFLDVPFRVEVQLGSKSMTIRDILQLKKSSIIQLQKSAGENVDILVNGVLVAYGEVLDMEGNAGIRLTDIHTQI